MSFWVQDARRAAEQNTYDAGSASLPYIGQVTAVDIDGEQITVDGAITGVKTYNAPQVFSSTSSWIRSTPDAGIGVMMQQSADAAEPIVIRYFLPGASDRAAAYQSAARDVRKNPTKKDGISGLTNWRVLKSGEHQIASSGLAEFYLSGQGAAELRGGLVTRGAIHDDAQTLDSAPLHQRTGLLYSYGSIGDEERLGVVRRPESSGGEFKEKYIRLLNPAGYIVKPPKGLLTNPIALAKFLIDSPPIPMTAAKEWLVNLGTDGGLQPDTLFDMRIGHVFEDDGQLELDQVISKTTGVKLRARTQYYTAPLGSVLETQVDELGNVTVDFPIDALFGAKVNIPLGGFELDVGLDLKLNVLKGLVFSAIGKWAATALGGIDLSTALDMALASQTVASLKAPIVLLGEDPTDPAVSPTQGVITGMDLDLLSGRPLSSFGQGSTIVFAKK